MKLPDFIAKRKPNVSLAQLRLFNECLALLFAVQAIAILFFSKARIFPVETSYLTGNPVASELAGSPVWATASRHLFDINLTYVVVTFLLIAAAAHALAATLYRERYEADIKRKVNQLRWIEYALNAGVILVAVALVVGVADLSTLLMLFAFGELASLLGYAMEAYGMDRVKPHLLAYKIAGLVGLVPWLILAIYLGGADMYASSNLPGYAYWVFGSMLVLFAGFALNMYLQNKKIGPWRDYLYGERMYMVLDVVKKTALAWLLYFGALRP